MTSDKAAVNPVAYVSPYSLESLARCRNDDHNGYVEAWMRPDDERTEPLYTATTIKQLQADHAAALQVARDEVESLKHEAEQKDQAIAKSYAREKLASRRVAELEATIRGLRFDTYEATTPEMCAAFDGKTSFVVLQTDTLKPLLDALAPAKKVD